MVSLARVLLRDNALLLVDEPTKGSPPSSSPRSPTSSPKWLATPILLVEQNLPLVRRIADTVVVLDAGEVVHRGTAAALVADPELTRELLGVSMRREGAA